MFTNYLITAWKVFLRRKFFTFINLFGISLTLTVLMVVSTMVDSFFYPAGPEKNNDHFRVISHLTLTNETHNETNSGRLGYKFIKDNIWRLKTPELISINSGVYITSIFHNGQKKKLMVKKTDSNYWKVLDFNMIKGRFYNNEELNKGQLVSVINQNTEKELFGNNSAVGQTFSLEKRQFTVIGVVENVSAIEETALSDIWIPYTANATTDYQQEIRGSWDAVLFHSNSAMLDEANKEYIHLLKNDLILDTPEKLTKAYSGAYSKLESISRQMFREKYSYESHVELLVAVMILLVLLFMLLPSINMINLNMSRMMERSSEIGVRKAFGASTRQLLLQFIMESTLLTLAGGVLGIVMSLLLLNAIETSGIIPYAVFNFNIRVFFVGLLLILIFALISGLYPAYKMSRLNPVTALKGGI